MTVRAPRLTLLSLAAALAAAAGSVAAAPAPSARARLDGDAVVFDLELGEPALARLKVEAGGRRLTALAHLPPGDTVRRLSLAGLRAHGPVPAEALWEVEFRFRRWRFERFVGGTGKSEGRFVDPCRILAGSRGRLYVVDRGNDRVQAFDGDYRYLFEFGGFSWNAARSGNEVQGGRLDDPSGVAESASRELLVTDRANNRVVRYDLQGRYLGEFGNGELRLPEGLAADRSEAVVVCDVDHDRVLRFDTAGRLDAEIGGYGWGRRQFNRPTDAAFDPAGNLYVVDRGNGRIQVFDRALRPTVEIRLDGVSPEAVDVDPEFFVYVVDGPAARVLVLDNTFAAVHALPAPGDTWTLTRPTDVASSADGRLHVLDAGKNSVAIVRVEQDVLVRRGKVALAGPR